MQASDLFKDYTLQGTLDMLNVIEFFECPGKEPRVGGNAGSTGAGAHGQSGSPAREGIGS